MLKQSAAENNTPEDQLQCNMDSLNAMVKLMLHHTGCNCPKVGIWRGKAARWPHSDADQLTPPRSSKLPSAQ